MLRSGQASHDMGNDLFVEAAENRAVAQLKPRAEPGLPTDRRQVLLSLLRRLFGSSGEDGGLIEPLVAQRDWEDPLEWLHSVAQLSEPGLPGRHKESE
jgi:hypothetical protein